MIFLYTNIPPTQLFNKVSSVLHVVSTVHSTSVPSKQLFKKVACGEPAISLHSHHVSLSSGLPICFPSWGTRVQSPGGYLCETGILLLALSCYIGDPDVINHCGLIWGELHPEPSLGRRADNVIIPLDLTQLFCPGFTLAAGPPSGFTTDRVGCWGVGGSPVESLQSHYINTIGGLPTR
jgi:hypothetical protein